MAITGAQMKTAIGSIPGALGGQIASWDALAAGANDAMRRIGVRTPVEAALFLATMAKESAYFRTATEYGASLRYDPYRGRTFEQITWKSNYSKFGTWAKNQAMISDAALFVKAPARLSESTWWWLGGVWYWTMTRRDWGNHTSVIEVARTTGSIWAVSRAVNAGSPNWPGTPAGMTDRIRLFDAFKALGASIVPSSSVTLPTGSAATAPAQAIPGSVATVLAMANKLWAQYKGKYWGGAWPGWKELGYQNVTAGPWCAAFLWLCLRKATGYDWSAYCSGPAYTPTLDSWMRRSPAYAATTYAKAVPGDFVFFLDEKGKPYHVEIVEFAASPGGHDLRTIGGNTSTAGISQSMSNGGTLAKKTRDDRYLRMRIWHPTYWVPASQVPTPENPLPTTPDLDGDVIEVVPGQPTLPAYDIPDEPLVRANPIEELRVSDAFLASRFAGSANKACRVDAYLGGVLVAAGLPVNAAQSKVTVTTNSPVRRRCSLELMAGRYGARFNDLPELLAEPGMRLHVRSGFSWGGADETVPVGEFLCDDFTVDPATGKIKVDQPDTMALAGMMGFGKPTGLGGMTYTECLRFLLSEADPGAQIVDLTGNTATMPTVLKDSGASSRIDAIMELADAIGAEIFKSPALGYYVLRPVQHPGTPARWTTVAGRDLKTVTRGVRNSRLRNEWNVTSERSDQAQGRGVWRDLDPDSATRVGGPFGYRVGFYSTSLIPSDNREALDAMAAALGAKTMGQNIDLAWSALANPLAEGGDPYDVVTDGHTYRCVLDDFDLPLGAQRVAPASARTLSIPGATG